MTDPVVAADGFTYERTAITDWIGRPRSPNAAVLSPCTGLPMPSPAPQLLLPLLLLPNTTLRNIIRAHALSCDS
jgi:hypothetical protein